MKTLKELQTLRAALLAEREQLIEQTPELENNWRMGSITHNFLGNPIPAPETTAAMEAVSEAEARIQAITSEIERPNGLNDQVAYLERLAAADDTIAKATADSTTATNQANRLAASLQLVQERLANMQAESQLAKEAAQQDEQTAAQAIASATASGDGKAEKAAQALMAEAIEAGRQAEAKERTNQAVINALAAEAEALQMQLVRARQKAEAAELTAATNRRLKLQDEWNNVVETLAGVGERLTAAGERFTGLTGLNKLSVPTFGPVMRELTSSSLVHRTKGQAA